MADRRNILFIQTDAQHHQWLGFQGAPGLKTPHLDRLARERAVVFDQAYTCSGVCAPSRTSFITGRYPVAHGVVNNQVRRRSPAEPLLGRLLQQAGYATGYFGKTHFAGDDDAMSADGWEQSFTIADYKKYLQQHRIDATYPEKKGIDRLPGRYWNFGASRIPNEHYLENILGDLGVQFIERHADRPFACFVNCVAPHSPFTPPRPYAELYNPADMILPEPLANDLADKPAQTRKWIAQNQKYLNEPELRNWLAMVYGLLSMIDDNVGKLIGALERQGVLDQTLIVFTSDHGDFAGRRGVIGKSWCLCDDVLHIPLLIAAPGVRRRRTDALVQNIDVTATLLDFAGVTVPQRMHGRSLAPLMHDANLNRHRDCVFAHDQAEYSRDKLYQSAVRTPDWKYIESTGRQCELYDLRNDPAETRNLATDPAQRERVDRMRQDLLQWHLNHAGGFYAVESTDYWEDETHFYDETAFTGERIPRGSHTQ